uniref:ADAMTS-like 3 n=1 Tax=Anabas testudineus TaxID=64144 RepID=A0A7N6FC88_ANATE
MTMGKIHIKMESFILQWAVLLFLMLPSFQCAESHSQTAVFLPEFALSPQGSFMEDATEDQFLTYRYDDQASRMTRSDEDRDIGWDAWGSWSDCSRTCGGGASYSLRRCLNGGNCDGKNIRYKTCSNLDCPTESGDFRAQQCSAHNDIKYQGVTYEWVPAPYDPSAPCALKCQSKGRSLTVELAPKVLDGTRCRADAFDMCISGVCQEVGCDRQLASGAREDNCGVCGGDGSTCRLVRGQTVLEVPVGSRFLRLNAKGPDVISIEAVSLEGRKEETSLVSTAAYVIGNTSLDFQRGTDRQTLRTHGPLNADYIIKVKQRKKSSTVVQFLFYQPIGYQWRETGFFPCSVTCGGGYQLNSAECIDIRTNQTLPEHHCNRCCIAPVLYACSWEQGPWTQCSVSCGESGGWQDRSVLCVEEDSHGQFSQVEEWKCTHSPRPVTRQICNTFTCPQWVAMEWSQCTVTCGRGLRYRVVLCIDHRGQHIGGCEASVKPHVKEECLVPIACHKPRESLPVEAKVPWLKQAHELEEHHTATEEPTFIPGPWSPCSTTCGPGRQTREVKCRVLLSFTKTEVDLPEEECGKDRPQLVRHCNQGPCAKVPGISSGLQDYGPTSTDTEKEYNWDYRGFTACSATCAAGKQTAIVRCIDRKQGEEVEDSLCDSSSRPPVMIRICNPEPCPPRWEVTAWTRCSSSCGVGIQTRSVFCMRFLSMDQQDILTVSEDECREFKPAILQPCNQVDCPPVWETEPWQQCSQSCGGGVQVRKVYCKQLLSTGAYRRLGDEACWGIKPITSRACSTTDCLPYMVGGEWGKCSVSCGLGIQRRDALCRQLTATGQQMTLARELCSGLPSRPTKVRGYKEDVKRCPLLMGEHHIYIQTRKQKRLYLTIGGHAYLLPNTSLVIKCPVRSFPKDNIRWFKDRHSLPSSKHQDITKSGSLKIRFLREEDTGVYKCVAGPASDIFTLQLIGSDSRPSGTRLSTPSPNPSWEDIMPSCHKHYSNLHLVWPGVILSLVPHVKALSPYLLAFIIPFVLCLSGFPQPTVKWHKKNGQLAASVVLLPSGSLWIRNVSLHNQGTYSCTATNTIGKSTASTVLQVYEFGWRFGEWTTCSASCGNRGTWLRRVRCVTLDGKDVQPTMCQHISKPIVSPVPCNRQDCPPSWMVSEWSKCSASCGSGWKQRWVSCRQLDARGEIKTLTAFACERMNRPTDTEQCTANNCPTWVTSPWGKCSGRCLDPTTTVQKRSVICQHANGSLYSDCDLRNRPVSVRNCSSDLCDVHWRPAAWRTCTVVCGSGFQSRRVDCVHRRSGRTLADQHCAWLQRPSTWQHCNSTTCGSDCKDSTQYCSVVKRLKLCHMDMYKQRCCGSCSQNTDT